MPTTPEPTVTITWTETWTMSHTMPLHEAVEFARDVPGVEIADDRSAVEVAYRLDHASDVLAEALAEFDVSTITRADVFRHGVSVTATSGQEG